MSTLILPLWQKSFLIFKNFLVIVAFILYTKIIDRVRGEKMPDKKNNRNIRMFIIIAAAIVFFLFLLNFKMIQGFFTNLINILSPFIIGFAIAYLLDPTLNFFEDTIFCFVGSKTKGAKLRRVLAIITTMLSAVIVLTTLVSIIIPQLSQSLATLFNNAQSYITRLEEYIYDLAKHFGVDTSGFDETFTIWEKVTTDLLGTAQQYLPEMLNYLPDLFDFSKQLTTGISSALIGIVVSIYLLFGKERFCAQIKKLGYAVFKPQNMDKVLDVARFSHKTFNGFIVGKLIDSLIIGVLAFISTEILGMPFPLLLSVIIGITNIIPFFGPIVGGIIGGLIVVMADPSKILWFVIFVVVLQQLDGNIIGPKILGDSTGLPALWVMFAIIVFGGMFGFVGMFVGVPFFSVVYALTRNYSEKRLKEKKLPTKTADYYTAAPIAPEEQPENE